MVIEQIYSNNLEKLSEAVLQATCDYVKANKSVFDAMYRDLLAQTGDVAKTEQELKEYILKYFVIPLTNELKNMF